MCPPRPSPASCSGFECPEPHVAAQDVGVLASSGPCSGMAIAQKQEADTTLERVLADLHVATWNSPSPMSNFCIKPALYPQ